MRDMMKEKWQKIKKFLDALAEFMRRPKTVFDIKDRARLLILLLCVIAVIEWLLGLRLRW